MDLLLRGRGTDTGARAPVWLVRLAGAVLGYAMLALADRIGLSDITSIPPLYARLGAMIVGASVATTSVGGVLWLLSGILVAVCMVVAFTPVVIGPAQHFIRRDESTERVDAVVVLSGAINDDGRLTGVVLDRLLSALGEAQRRGVSTVALSVVERGRGVRHTTSENDQRELMALLAPDVNVKFVHNVESTRDEALQFAALARTNRWHRVLLVTSPLHTRRACRTVEVAGLPVTCTPAESRAFSVSHLNGAGARLDAFQNVLYETAATILYSIRGWI